LKHDTDLGTLTLRQYVNAKRKTKQNEIKEYEKQYLSRYKEPKTKKNTGSSLYKPEILKPKRNMKKERKEYEQKYLSRYKQPKSGVKKSTSWTQHDVALGRLTLSPHFNAKRRAKQDEIKEYEKQYLSRYKQPNPKKSVIQVEWKPEPKRDIGKERKDYENEFLTRYRKEQKAKPKKRAIQVEWEPEPKQDIKKERKDYERKYVSRFTKLQKTKLKIAALEQKLRLSQLELEEPKIDRKKERKDYEKEYLSRLKNNL